jgi:AraC family transcriptional activator of mtrCDE
MLPVRGHLDLRCFYGAPWRIEEDRAKPGEIPYHVVLERIGRAGRCDGWPAETPRAGRYRAALPRRRACMTAAAPHRLRHERAGLNLTISENAGAGDRLDMLCGRFVFTASHERPANT